MGPFDFSDFQRNARAQGYDEVFARRWPANAVIEVHSHPFAVKALVTEGEMWLTVGDATRHLKIGDTFELDRGVPHAERYGAEGATYWVARRAGDPEPAA
jgi:hypothetical protein